LHEMNPIIVSDLHIGSHHFLYDDFKRFLGNVSVDHELTLNGDIIDNPYENLKPPHQRILDLIEQRSYRQKVFGYEVTTIMDMMQSPVAILTTQRI
jgi:UDP-2,3-diacylglucosamine pyrophosphatase LpxH